MRLLRFGKVQARTGELTETRAHLGPATHVRTRTEHIREPTPQARDPTPLPTRLATQLGIDP